MPMTSLSMQAFLSDTVWGSTRQSGGHPLFDSVSPPSLKNPGNNSEITHQGHESKRNDIQLYKVLIVKLSGCKEGKGSPISPERYLSSWN